MFFDDGAEHRLARRLDTIERKLDLLIAHFGIEQPAPQYPEVVRYIEQGKKINAVKAYRAATGVGLVEAKEAVDEMIRQLRR